MIHLEAAAVNQLGLTKWRLLLANVQYSATVVWLHTVLPK